MPIGLVVPTVFVVVAADVCVLVVAAGCSPTGVGVGAVVRTVAGVLALGEGDPSEDNRDGLSIEATAEVVVRLEVAGEVALDGEAAGVLAAGFGVTDTGFSHCVALVFSFQ